MSIFTPYAKPSRSTRIALVFATWMVLIGGLELAHRSNGIIPAPLDILRALGTLSQNGLLQALWESYKLNLAALSITIVLGCGFAYLSVIPFFRPLVRILSKFRFLGFSGVSFILGIYVFGRWLQIWMLVFGVAMFFLTSMLSVVSSVPEEDLDYARTLRMTPWQITYHMVIRGTFDQMLVITRQNAAMGWVMLTAVEGMVRAEGGLGVMMIDFGRRLMLKEIFAIGAVIVSVALLQDLFLVALRSWLCDYAQSEEE